MLVGEVRWATTGLGSSWKLSGGRAWSSGPTNVVEEPPRPAGGQAERARVRGDERLGASRSVARAGSSSEPPRARQPTAGERAARGPGLRAGRTRRPTAARGQASAAAPSGGRSRARSRREPGLGLRRRHPFQQPAARHVHAGERPHDRVGHQPGLCASIVSVSADLRGGQHEVPADRARRGCAWRCRAAAGSRRPAPAGARACAMVARTKRVHTRARRPAASTRRGASGTSAGADNVRRRLSSIFQRPISRDPRRVAAEIHGSSCQSPRAQRCWRAAATP